MSENISCSERASALLERLRGWDDEPLLHEVRSFGEQCPDELFRHVVEPLCDSFSVRDARVYSRMMQAFIPVSRDRARAIPPAFPARVYVLSRVTLGSDLKITSVMLDAAKRRYPASEIVLVGARKAAELFSEDPRVTWKEADYPRTGPLSARLQFVRDLKLSDGIVIDPDSRMTQLGLEVPFDNESYFHFPSRTWESKSDLGLSALAGAWTEEVFRVRGFPYMAPARFRVESPEPRVAVSLGVGDNPAKRIGGAFEPALIRLLASRFASVHLDRGAGGEERERVDRAVHEAGDHIRSKIHFCDGSFAEFASVISQCEAYYGYDSAGQHAGAVAGTPVTTIFSGAPNERFRIRWQPEGTASIRVIMADGMTAEEILNELH